MMKSDMISEVIQQRENTRLKELLQEAWGSVDNHYPMLSDKNIKLFNKAGLLIEQPLTDIQLQPNSVDLTLGDTWKKLKPNSDSWWHRKHGIEEIIDTKREIEYQSGNFPVNDDGIKYYIVHPDEFVLMASNEILNLPNGIISLVCGRSSIARLGIQTEQAGFIDAGFRGTITFEIHNQNKYPIALYAGMRIAQIYFLHAAQSDRLYGLDKGSKYKDQISATESRIHLDPEFRLPEHLTKTPTPEIIYETFGSRPPKNRKE